MGISNNFMSGLGRLLQQGIKEGIERLPNMGQVFEGMSGFLPMAGGRPRRGGVYAESGVGFQSMLGLG